MRQTKNDTCFRKNVKNALDGTMGSMSDDLSIHEPTLHLSVKHHHHHWHSINRKSATRWKCLGPRTTCDNVVKVAPVEKTSSDDKSVLGEGSIPNPGLTLAIMVEQSEQPGTAQTFGSYAGSSWTTPVHLLVIPSCVKTL